MHQFCVLGALAMLSCVRELSSPAWALRYRPGSSKYVRGTGETNSRFEGKLFSFCARDGSD
jgi:hypothetical protein